jgi:hypothetical protein
VFFCYNLPAKDITTGEWTEEAGQTKWYLYTISGDNEILGKPTDIIAHIRCDKNTPRKETFEKETLKELRAKMDEHIKNTYLRSVQAPIGVKPILKAWMEIS